MNKVFDRDCRQCPRLAAFLDQVKEKYPDYYCGPVPPFGDPAARFLIVGLAPGMHGANRTSRPFTGDHAGILLYETIHDYGFSTAACSESADDDLRLLDCRITNAVKCLPPDNKPVGAEINTCNSFLANDCRRSRMVQWFWHWVVSLTVPLSRRWACGRPSMFLDTRPNMPLMNDFY